MEAGSACPSSESGPKVRDSPLKTSDKSSQVPKLEKSFRMLYETTFRNAVGVERLQMSGSERGHRRDENNQMTYFDRR